MKKYYQPYINFSSKEKIKTHSEFVSQDKAILIPNSDKNIIMDIYKPCISNLDMKILYKILANQPN